MNTRSFFALVLLELINVANLMGNFDDNQKQFNGNIKILCTAAITTQNYEQRKQQYIRNLILLKRYGCEIYVVESCQQGPTFLDDYCNNVCYTNSNNPSITKSYNEALSMNIGLNYFKFGPEDMIIKVTGRYALETDEFIRLVSNNSDADAIIRAWNQHDAYTGIYAIRAKYFSDFLNNHYLNYMDIPEKQYYAIEHGLGNYVTIMAAKGLKIVYLPRVYDYLPICSIFLPNRKYKSIIRVRF